MSATTAAESHAPRTQPERPDVFISYSRKDEEFVRRLADALESREKDVWVDWEDIRKTADWRERIEAGIESAKAVVAVLSPDFAASEICGEEIDHAVQQNKRLVPIVRRDVDRSTLREELNAPNWIFFREPDDFGASLEDLVEALETDLAWTDAHARLLVRALEWDRNGRDRNYLLRGSDLARAERWLAEQGSHREAATPLQADYVVAGRHAATRRQRTTVGAILVALAVALALAVVALLQRNTAVANEKTARSRELAAKASAQLATDPQLSVLLATEAAHSRETPEAEDALRTALSRDFAEHTLRGHGFFVENVRFDRTGRRLLTVGNDTARLWDAANGRPLRVFRERGDILDDAALSPDGKLVATVGIGASVWDIASGKRRARLGGEDGPHGAEVRAVEFSPDGSLIATASDDETTALWNARTGGRRHVLAHAGGDTVAFSPDGRVVATAGDVPRLWDAAGGRLLHVLPGPPSVVGRVAFSPDGSLVAAALTGSGNVGTARIWDVRTGRVVQVLTGHTLGVEDVAFDRSGKLLATGSADDTAAVWRVADGRRLADLRGHADFVNSVEFSPDSRFLLTGSSDGTARVWDASSGRTVAELLGHTDVVSRARFSPDGTRIATASQDETARIWRSPTAGAQESFLGGEARFGGDGDIVVTAASLDDLFVYDRKRGTRRRLRGDDQLVDFAVSPDGSSVLTAEDLGDAVLWDTHTGRRRVTMAPSGGAFTVAFSPDGKTLAVGDSDGKAWLYRTGDKHSFRSVRHPPPPPPKDEFDVEAPEAGLQDVAFSADGKLLVTTSSDWTARVWDIRTAEQLSVVRAGDIVWSAAFSPDGALVASVATHARLWDARTGRVHARLGGRETTEYAPSFSPDGRGLLLVEDKAVRVRDVDTGRIRVELRSPAFSTLDTKAAFSKDGRFVVTGDSEAVRVWDAARGSQIEAFHGGGDGGVQFSSDGRLVLASSGKSSAIYACELCGPLDELLATAKRLVQRSLSPDERRLFLHQ